MTAPVYSNAQQAQYFTDLARADPSLASYVDEESGVALRALISTGSVFCVILHRGTGIDDAMTALAAGAKSVEASTHLPFTETTFDAIESVALLTLCPAEQTLLPAADRTDLSQLSQELAGGGF